MKRILHSFKNMLFFKEAEAKGVFLGKNDSFFGNEEYLSDQQLNHHVHIVGASGYGKTVLLSHIVKRSTDSNRGILFIDQKGDIETINQFRSFVEKANRQNDLQIFSLTDDLNASSYNLLNNGSATELRDRIMSSLVWSEEFYKNQAASFLLSLLTGLVWLRKYESLSIDVELVLECLNDHRKIESYLGKIPITEDRPWKLLDSARLTVRNPDTSKTLQGLRTQLESIAYSDFGSRVRATPNGIDLFETVRSGKITFMFLDTRRFGETAKAVGRFIIQDLKSVSARIDAEVLKQDRKPFVVVIDEFSDLAQEDFIQFLDRARSSKMGIVLAHQEISDLNRISPEFCGRLMGNTATLFAFLQKRPESAELIAGVGGTKKVWKETKAIDRFFGVEVDTGKRSKREVEEFNVHPNVIKSLGVGECVRIGKYPRSKVCKLKVRISSC